MLLKEEREAALKELAAPFTAASFMVRAPNERSKDLHVGARSIVQSGEGWDVCSPQLESIAERLAPGMQRINEAYRFLEGSTATDF